MDVGATIESKGWCVELFPVEVGARGYCSRSVLCCFKKLGLNNKLIRNTIKKLSKSSMEFSFCIWLARNKEWTPAANCKLNVSSKETYNSESSMHLLSRPPSQGQMQSHFDLKVSSIRVILVMPIPSCRF